MVYFENRFPIFLPQQLPEYLLRLPHLSIAIELLITLGIFIRPLIFTHVVGLFLLVLSYFHPPVLFVYILLLPVLMSINDGFNDFLQRSSFSNALRSPYFWALFTLISMSRAEVLSITALMTFVFISFFIFIHVYYFLKNPNTKSHLSLNWNNLRDWRLFLLPIIMLILFLGSFIILPSPIGFKMFSSRSFQIPHYKLIIEGPWACRSAEKAWAYSQVADASWSPIDQSSCYVRFPTQSGLLFLKNKLCEKFNQTTFILQRSDDTLIENMNCDESSTNQTQPTE